MALELHGLGLIETIFPLFIGDYIHPEPVLSEPLPLCEPLPLSEPLSSESSTTDPASVIIGSSPTDPTVIVPSPTADSTVKEPIIPSVEPSINENNERLNIQEGTSNNQSTKQSTVQSIDQSTEPSITKSPIDIPGSEPSVSREDGIDITKGNADSGVEGSIANMGSVNNMGSANDVGSINDVGGINNMGSFETNNDDAISITASAISGTRCVYQY